MKVSAKDSIVGAEFKTIVQFRQLGEFVVNIARLYMVLSYQSLAIPKHW